MKNDMKLIMESWRKKNLTEAPNPRMQTIGDFRKFVKIHRAKEAGKESKPEKPGKEPGSEETEQKTGLVRTEEKTESAQSEEKTEKKLKELTTFTPYFIHHCSDVLGNSTVNAYIKTTTMYNRLKK